MDFKFGQVEFRLFESWEESSNEEQKEQEEEAGWRVAGGIFISTYICKPS